LGWALVACSGQPEAKPPKQPVIRAMPTAEPEEPAPPTTPEAPERRKPGPIPVGPSSLSIHIPPGKRQPIVLDGTIDAMRPPRGPNGFDAWTEVTVQAVGGKTEFHLLHGPDALALPITVGDRVHVEIDCRKGGWHRVCDGKIVDPATRRVLMIISGSGDEEVAKGWKVERGPVGTSEIHPGKVRVVEHTHALTFASERASVTALPHQWARVLVHGRSYLVQGHETVWEGPPPPDARDHREFAIVLER
jgi:hypothetical protein